MRRERLRPEYIDLPQMTFDVSAGRPRLVAVGNVLLRVFHGAVYRYGGRSRWYPDFTVPQRTEAHVRHSLLAKPVLDHGEVCPLLSA